MKTINKKGDLSWQLVALMIVGLMVLFIILAFSGVVKEKFVEGVTYITGGLLGR
jgi:hypothetical protein